MARFRYDRSSKWLISHHGNLLLRLAGIEGAREWRSLQLEVVQPRKFPDGLLEVFLGDSKEPTLFLLEITIYSDNRVPDQLLDDPMLIYQDRGVLPEILSIILAPKGKVRVKNQIKKRAYLASPNYKVPGESLNYGSWTLNRYWLAKNPD